jgi:hypothetical protein
VNERLQELRLFNRKQLTYRATGDLDLLGHGDAAAVAVVTAFRDICAVEARIARNVVVLTGGMGAKQRQATMQRLDDIPTLDERVLIATGRYIGEGSDDARLDTPFLAMPVAWKGTLAQYRVCTSLEPTSSGGLDFSV